MYILNILKKEGEIIMNKLIYLCQKDIKQGLRVGKLYIIIGILLSLTFMVVPIYVVLTSTSYENVNSLKIISSSIINYIPFIIIYIMLFTGNSITQKLISREKNNKTTIPLLCAGITPKKYWLSKLLSVFTITFSISLIFVLILLLITLVLTPDLLISKFKLLLIQIFITPLFSLVFIGITELLYMISLKFWVLSMFFMLIPIMIFPYWNKLTIFNNNYYILGLGLLCIFLIFILSFLANCISRKRLSGIFELT